MSLGGVNSFFTHLLDTDRASGTRCQEPQIKQTRGPPAGGAGGGNSQIRSRCTIGGMVVKPRRKPRQEEGTGMGQFTSAQGPGRNGRWAGRSTSPFCPV